MNMPPNHEWTSERVDQLTKLWGTGLSASEIGRKLGITKNAVVAIRNKSYWNFNSLSAKDPVAINLFSQKDLTDALEKADRRIKRERKLKEKAQKQNLQTG